MLEVKHLSVRYGELTIVSDASFSARENDWLMIVGPNGAGKSTILTAITQGAPYTGEVLVGGADVSRMKSAERARMLGVLAQSHTAGYAFSVREVVELGRYAYSRGRLSPEDRRMIDIALERTGMAEKARQSVLTLSGGELQRTFLAQAFAQDPKLLLLDEPTNHLDLMYQKQMFALIADWAAQPGRAVISVMHDLSMAKRFGTKALLVDKGRIVAEGRTGDVIEREKLASVYRIDVYAWMQEQLAVWE